MPVLPHDVEQGLGVLAHYLLWGSVGERRVGPPAGALLLKTPAKKTLDAAIDHLPEGPTEESRQAVTFTVAAIAQGVDSTISRGSLTGTDVYGITAVIAVEGAARMADPGYHRAGALASSVAYDPDAWVEFLKPHGMRYELADAVGFGESDGFV